MVLKYNIVIRFENYVDIGSTIGIAQYSKRQYRIKILSYRCITIEKGKSQIYIQVAKLTAAY